MYSLIDKLDVSRMSVERCLLTYWLYNVYAIIVEDNPMSSRDAANRIRTTVNLAAPFGRSV